jgi:hypothetical protein
MQNLPDRPPSKAFARFSQLPELLETPQFQLLSSLESRKPAPGLAFARTCLTGMHKIRSPACGRLALD